MYTYETGPLNHKQLRAFTDKFKSIIGTEYEIESNSVGSHEENYVICHELENEEEVNMCKEIEQNLER